MSPAAAELRAYPWIYLREGVETGFDENDPQSVSVVIVGDVMLGRGAAAEPDPFGEAAHWLQAGDLTLGNLEGAVAPEADPSGASEDAPQDGPYRLIAPPEAAGLIAQAGFDLLGLANNHALDRGLAGLAETSAALHAAGLDSVGAGPQLDAAYRPVVRTAGGLKIAFLAFNAVPSPRGPEWSGEVRQAEDAPGWTLAGWEPEAALSAVRDADEAADAVVVSIHWGYEYDLRVDPAQRDIAAQLAAAGADLIAGHHPHVVQPVETLSKPGGGEALVAYSLGNFVFDQGFDETGQGLALRAIFDRRGLRALQALPVHAGLRPARMAPGEASGLLERISPEFETTAWECNTQTCHPVAAQHVSPGESLFSEGAADLDADGRPETIRLDAGLVRVEGYGGAGWESPPEWRVIDLAVGDPNQDGRQELLLAVQKPDRAGIPLSHPFLLGHREGELRLLWGGSAVSDPILEVELGDVDGDGRQELVVLESLHGGPERAISVWRWHGWGFSRVWRSPPGAYSRLRLAGRPGTAGVQIVADQPAG